MSTQAYGQAEAGGLDDGLSGLNSKTIRNKFIQKVYALLSIQFLLTVGICALFIFNDGIKHYIAHNSWPLYTALIVYLVTGFTIICCSKLQRQVPINYILLFALTLAMSVMLGVVCAFTELDAVLIAAAATCGATLAVSLFSCWTKFDFTKMIWIAAMLGLVLMFTGFFTIFYRDRMSQVLYGGAGAAIMMLYLAIDTQLIVGGRRFEISEEDYIFAALTLYLDIVNLFMFILRMVKS